MNFNNLKEIKNIEAVYGIHNIITNKWYIGSTINLHDRIRRHRYYLLHNQHHSSKLQRSFNKYGIDSFEIVIIKQFNKLDIEQLVEQEIDTINKYNSLDNGYNMVKDSRIYKNFKLSKEAIKKVSDKHSIPIICLTLDGNFVKKFNSITQAAKELGDQTTNISKACNHGTTHSVKGYMLLYEKDYDPTKSYKYKRSERTLEHINKIREKAKNNKRTRKIIEYDINGKQINQFNSISALERDLNIKKDNLKCKIKLPKTEFNFTFNNRYFKISKSYSYKDIV